MRPCLGAGCQALVRTGEGLVLVQALVWTGTLVVPVVTMVSQRRLSAGRPANRPDQCEHVTHHREGGLNATTHTRQ